MLVQEQSNPLALFGFRNRLLSLSAKQEKRKLLWGHAKLNIKENKDSIFHVTPTKFTLLLHGLKETEKTVSQITLCLVPSGQIENRTGVSPDYAGPTDSIVTFSGVLSLSQWESGSSDWNFSAATEEYHVLLHEVAAQILIGTGVYGQVPREESGFSGGRFEYVSVRIAFFEACCDFRI